MIPFIVMIIAMIAFWVSGPGQPMDDRSVQPHAPYRRAQSEGIEQTTPEPEGRKISEPRN
ncbi:hypothetical protein [Salinibacter ruber]|uniref:Uncharacterized protein n=1 Tax=Salinibacter ruber TaxID=146919 RepID=A0A9X2QEB6_9BACT|nr:hypothetical protein [Salinibacter ruber]MCS3661747.1 hypothetical protein [Salinibacter ruber]MCS3711592.1 hypothetical protein [Salinibacter ruber]